MNKESGRLSFAFLILPFAFALSVSGCKKFIEIPPPSSRLVTATVFNNDATATSAVINIYLGMFNNLESPTIAANNGLLADELTNYSGNAAGNTLFNYYTNHMGATFVYGEWVNAYNYIYQANAVLSGLQQYKGTSPATKSQLMGEAYFIRAFWHFYLTNAFGAVPVALTTDYTVTDRLSRTPRIQVLQQVISDLQMAKGLLSNNYVDASDSTVTNDRVRPNKAVATALLARAYLYLGDYNHNDQPSYTNAENAATELINNSTYSLCTNLSGPNSVFLANSSEAIWQLYTPLPNTDNTQDGDNFILIGRPTNVTISLQLLKAFEPGDQRKVNWIGSITEDTSTYYFPYKYKVSQYVPSSNPSTVTEYTMVLRLAEQYLIRAEAKAELGDATAVNDLNKIRNRAGLANYAGATDRASLLGAIQHERQVELFTEWGHRWFDLNRAINTSSTVNSNTVLGSPGNVCHFKGGTWNSSDYQTLYPITNSEIAIDHNLTQNPGY